jgi:diguanylate cyclase (GGDEF)-like protein
VGRIGGDEFVVLLPLIRDDADVTAVALKIRQALGQAFDLGDSISLHISCSNGIATYPEHGANEVELAKNADAAMYLAKQGGRNRVEIYSPSQATAQ